MNQTSLFPRARGCVFDTPHRKLGYTPIHKLLTPRASLNTNTVASVDKYRTLEIFDQGQTGSCEGHRAAMAIHVGMAAMGEMMPFVPSPRCLYIDGLCWESRDANAPLQDVGCMTSDIQLVMANCGVKAIGPLAPDGRHSDCTPENVIIRPTLTELAQEALFPIGGLYYIDTSPADSPIAMVQSALNQGYCVGLDIYADTLFENFDGHTPVNDCNLQDPTGGGHAILCTEMHVGATENEVVLLGPNSWGESWGADGYWQGTAAWFAKAVQGIVVFEMQRVGV